MKAFRRGQQDTEYLTLLADVYKQPLWAVAGGLRQRIDLGGKVLKASESDAGTIRFDKADASALWRLRMAVGQMLSSRRPAYRRCIRPMRSPPRDLTRLPPIGYVRVAPPLPPSAPEMD